MLLAERGLIDIEIKKDSDWKRKTDDYASVIVEYNGVRIVYDLMDGYQDISNMKYLLDESDIYFKRSFSSNVNLQFFTSDQIQKMYPLGMNYSVYIKNNPYCFSEDVIRRIIICCLRGERLNPYFTYKRFETTPVFKNNNIKVLFLTRLWDVSLENAEELNSKRIKIVRMLKREYGDSFIGGVRSSELALKYASDIVLSKIFTTKTNYLRIMKEADICIGTLGLHYSTGWKTGEYVAASKGIVNERLVYSNPGLFEDGKNYLSFENPDECCIRVGQLFSDPERLYEMKKANHEYYNTYLRPDYLILNTLKRVDNGFS